METLPSRRYSYGMPAGALLAIAIATEVAATVSLRYSDGFTKPLPSALVVLGYGFSFYLLALVLREISVSTTYAIWSGAGTAAVGLIGAISKSAARFDVQQLLALNAKYGLNLSGAH